MTHRDLGHRLADLLAQLAERDVVDAATVAPVPTTVGPVPLPNVGALATWRRELTQGRRGDPTKPATWPLDDLSRAAAWEMSAQIAWADGFPDAARDDLTRALECLGLRRSTRSPRVPLARPDTGPVTPISAVR